MLVVELVLSQGSTLQPTPAGGVTEALLTMSPLALSCATPLTFTVTLWPLARLTPVRLMALPVPLLLAPQLATGVQLQLLTATLAGTLSVTVTPLASLGPALLTTIW